MSVIFRHASFNMFNGDDLTLYLVIITTLLIRSTWLIQLTCYRMICTAILCLCFPYLITCQWIITRSVNGVCMAPRVKGNLWKTLAKGSCRGTEINLEFLRICKTNEKRSWSSQRSLSLLVQLMIPHRCLMEYYFLMRNRRERLVYASLDLFHKEMLGKIE